MKPGERTSPKVPERELRADAHRNRDRLLAAADAAFCEQGAGASLNDIAKRAKVGIGTLYRHFPTREALLAAACDARLLAIAERNEALSAACEPAAALEAALKELIGLAAMYGGLAASFGVVLQSDTPGCHTLTALVRRLFERAQLAGDVRRDVDFDDLLCVTTAMSLAAMQGPPHRVGRLLATFIDGLRAPARAK